LRADTVVGLPDGRGVPGWRSNAADRAPGAPAGSYVLSAFETVNLFNGNLQFALPLHEVSGRGDARHTIVLPSATGGT
jgi:hypothetical protein